MEQFQGYKCIRNMKNIHIYVFSNFPIFLHVNFSRGFAHYQYCTKLKKKFGSLQITNCSCLEKLRCIRHKTYIYHHP